MSLITAISYLQQTLLGFDMDNPSASLVHPGMDYFYAKRAEDERALLRALVLDLSLDYHKAKCHVNRLPVEILQEVFVYCLPDREWRIDKSPPPQLILSHVCSRWRDIALCYPRLWSTFMIVFPVPRHIPMVKMWLERSGQYPLNLYIDHQRWVGEEYTMPVTDAIIDLLRPHMHRWKTITFNLAAGVQSSLLALPRDSLPSLEALHFELDPHCGWWNPDTIRLIEEVFFPRSSNSSLKLRRVTWKTRSPPGVHIGSSLPTALTHLAAGFGMDHLFFHSLPQLKDLRILQLHSGLMNDTLPLPSPVIIPHLHTLEVRSGAATSDLLNSVNTPNLQVLAIGASLIENVLPAFIARSRCNLRAFSYFHPGIVEWEEFLSSPYLHSLSELNVLSYRDNNVVLKVLADERHLLPSLNRLWLATSECSIGPLLEMMKRREDDFVMPAGPMMSEPLLDSIEPYLLERFSTPPSGCSVCIQVLKFCRSVSRFDNDPPPHYHNLPDIVELAQHIGR